MLEANARCRLMLPVSVCLGIEKRDGSSKIKHSASLNSIRPGHFRYGLAILPSRNQDERASMTERYIRWYMPWLSRECEMIVVETGGALPLALFPTAFARHYQTNDYWRDIPPYYLSAL